MGETDEKNYTMFLLFVPSMGKKNTLWKELQKTDQLTSIPNDRQQH